MGTVALFGQRGSGMCKRENALRGRTFTGCWACRFKKRRCDETRPRCSLCVKHNDRCCYDVRLIWLDENMYRRLGRRLVKSADKQERRKISKRKFQDLTQYRALSPPSSDCESEIAEEPHVKKELQLSLEEPVTQKKIEDSFTISVRRLKIYDNAVSSVYGTKERNYEQKHVNSVLSNLLNALEQTGSTGSCCVDDRQGPFGRFSARCEFKSRDLPSPSEHHGSQESLRKKSYIDGLVENKIYTLLWLNTHGNMILSRVEYCTWFLAYMKRTLPYEFSKILEEIIDEANPFNITDWIGRIKSKWHSNPEWQAIAFTILTVVHGYTCPELTHELESWFQTQKTVSYSMFPLVNFIVRNTTSLSVLHHCYDLLNGNDENVEESYRAELTYELHVLVAGKLVNRWRDKILEQLCSCQDTSHSCSQLKFWELQLKHNEKFYKDVYSA